MTEKNKKKLIIGAAALLGIYLAGGIISALVMINCFIKRPKAGWPDPMLNLSGSRAPYEKELKEAREWLSTKKTEQVSIKSFDNLTLTGLLLCAPDEGSAKGTVLLMHGYHSRGDFEFTGFTKFFHNEGYNILLADQRCHGKSQGKYLTFGVKERYDCRDWISFLNSRFGSEKPVWLCGVSMGCSTVLMTLGFNLPDNVKGAVADCGFTSPAKIVSVCLKRDYHLPAPLLMPFINMGVKLCCGFSLYEYSTLDALKNNKIPVLFVHGTKDGFVPFEMGKENFEACQAPKIFVQTEASHAVNFLHDTDEYTSALKEFMK